ncbi:MAG: DEAD/DEAH box helicase family protein, partial [Spirochaetota bacterium]|nr:DEAD/DEAH box helicase family protein [Spirochaetota bacterium]
MGKIDQLIINSPYKEPMEYWKHDSRTDTFVREEGRRPSGYTVINQKFINEFIPIPLVNKIREKLKDWKKDDYKGITSITRRLLEHWHDPEQREGFQFFYCQIEAIETLIWWIEAPEEYKEGISISSDGGDFQRICSKMATGTGKTVVMCMLIAWQILNKVTYSQDLRFSKNVFVVAPGLTVKNRLQVLKPSEKENYYEQFNIIPTGLMESLLQGKIIIENWHTLSWDSEQNLKNKKSVDKRGAKSDKAYVKDILGEMSNSKSIIVINDEAHHAWRINPEDKLKNLNKSDIDEATVWINGLDRIHNVCGILNCFDFSATPFLPTGKTTTQDTLFSWIISDFSLNDSIESGLVKTPRVVIRDNALPDVNTYKSKLYHIYPHVKD